MTEKIRPENSHQLRGENHQTRVKEVEFRRRRRFGKFSEILDQASKFKEGVKRKFDKITYPAKSELNYQVNHLRNQLHQGKKFLKKKIYPHAYKLDQMRKRSLWKIRYLREEGQLMEIAREMLRSSIKKYIALNKNIDRQENTRKSKDNKLDLGSYLDRVANRVRLGVKNRARKSYDLKNYIKKNTLRAISLAALSFLSTTDKGNVLQNEINTSTVTISSENKIADSLKEDDKKSVYFRSETTSKDSHIKHHDKSDEASTIQYKENQRTIKTNKKQLKVKLTPDQFKFIVDETKEGLINFNTTAMKVTSPKIVLVKFRDGTTSKYRLKKGNYSISKENIDLSKVKTIQAIDSENNIVATVFY